MVGTEMVAETLVVLNELTRMVAREDFVNSKTILALSLKSH
jgi:hypothetical protein